MSFNQTLAHVQVTEIIVNTTGNSTDVDIPIPSQTNSIQITKGVEAAGSTAGMDVTVQGSIDGVSFFDLGTAGAALVFGLDDNGVTTVTTFVKHLRFNAALKTGDWQLHVNCINN